MEESSPRVDPDIEKVRNTTKLILTSTFRRILLTTEHRSNSLEKALLEVPVSSFSLFISFKSVDPVA